jgi:hypothetical protein
VFATIHLFLSRKKLQHMRKLVLAILVLPIISFAQKKQITLEDLYKNNTFQADDVPAF